MDQPEVLETVESIKKVILAIQSTEEIKNDVRQLDSFVTKDIRDFNTVGFVEGVKQIIVKRNLDIGVIQTIQDTLVKAFEDLKSRSREQNINMIYQHILTTSTLSFTPERFHYYIKKDYRDLATLYHDRATSVKYSKVLSDLREVYSKYNHLHTVQEFRQTLISSTLVSFPLNLRKDVESGIDEVVDRYLKEGKDPRCEEIYNDLLEVFIHNYNRLFPTEKREIKEGPLYAQAFLRDMMFMGDHYFVVFE